MKSADADYRKTPCVEQHAAFQRACTEASEQADKDAAEKIRRAKVRPHIRALSSPPPIKGVCSVGLGIACR